MKKLTTIVLLASVFFFVMPEVSLAGINSLNGLSTTAQTFATSTAPNSPHLLIQSSGTVHTFKWDSTPWLLSQGGTGATAFATGSIPFIFGSKFAENNANLFWDTLKSFLGIGNSSPRHALDVSGAMYSRLVVATPSTIDWNAGNVQTVTLTNSPTLTFVNGQAGGEYTLILNQDATGGRTVTWPASVKWENKTTPILTATANATDMAKFVFNGSYYLGSVSKNFGTPPPITSAQVALLVVGGGGGGGATSGGGGGAGGYQYNASHSVTTQAYAITVGGGGSGGTDGTQINGVSGSSSIFDTITAVGGGYGAGSINATNNGGNGGSGGGAGNSAINASLGGTGSQGKNGGNQPGGGGSGAGGGGNGTAGSDGLGGAGPKIGGAGGSGTANSITGFLVSYAGGGGGGGNSDVGGTGGTGGGGAGGAQNTVGANGVANTGGGGGGGGYNGTFFGGGAGGSGVVIISYPTGSLTATGGAVTTSGGNTIHTFTSSGTFTVSSIP